jgi:hypothetical protein
MFRSIKEIMGQKMGTLMEDPRFREQMIFYHWTRAAGPSIEQKTCPFRFTGSTLFVHTINSTWNAHLTSLKEQLLRALNSETAPLEIKDLRFSVHYPLRAPAETADRRARKDEEDPQKELEAITLTQEEEESAQTLARTLMDERQRDVMLKVLIKEKKWKKLLRQKGWKDCVLCGVPTPQEKLCPFCRHSPKEEASALPEEARLSAQEPQEAQEHPHQLP